MSGHLIGLTARSPEDSLQAGDPPQITTEKDTTLMKRATIFYRLERCPGNHRGQPAACSRRRRHHHRKGHLHLLFSTGTFPLHGLAFDAAGNLYGTTTTGGTKDCGTVYQLTPGTNGTWTQKLLVNFTCGNDGGQPQGPITVDALGNLYGTTWIGGVKGHGTVFRLTPKATALGNTRCCITSPSPAWTAGAPAGAIVFDSTVA